MMYQQKRDQNNVGEDGNLNVLGKVTPIFETLQKMRDNNVCGNLTMNSTEWNNAYAGSEAILFPGASWSVTFTWKRMTLKDQRQETGECLPLRREDFPGAEHVTEFIKILI